MLVLSIKVYIGVEVVKYVTEFRHLDQAITINLSDDKDTCREI